MMISCPKHGPQEGFEVSFDIAEAIREGRALPPSQEIVYDYRGDAALIVRVSHQLTNGHCAAAGERQRKR